MKTMDARRKSESEISNAQAEHGRERKRTARTRISMAKNRIGEAAVSSAREKQSVDLRGMSTAMIRAEKEARRLD